MSISALIEHLIVSEDADKYGRPRWATARTRTTQRLPARSSEDPTRVVQVTLSRSVHLTGLVYAARAGLGTPAAHASDRRTHLIPEQER